MKKILKLMMMAFVATVMTIGFAACSSDDDDNPNIYQAGITSNNLSSMSSSFGTQPSLKIIAQIENAYTAVGLTESFTASSDAAVKAKAQQAEANIGTIDWTGCKGSVTYSIKNIKSQTTVYSKTFSSNN